MKKAIYVRVSPANGGKPCHAPQISHFDFAQCDDDCVFQQPVSATMRDFRKLNIWLQAVELVTRVYRISAQLPDSEKYGLRSQIQRAAVSIASNIAEGASRQSVHEFRHFLEIAIGSSFELETQLLLIQNLKMLPQEPFNEISELISKEQKMLNSLISKLKESKHK